MAFEWVAGLFQSEEARGLSGESASSVALDDANPYYNYRLRRHNAQGDIVGDPGLIWYTSPYVKQRQGLGTHVESEVGVGVANYTDVLLILSHEDYSRAHAIAGEPWNVTAGRVLQQEFENFCRRENFRRPHAHRPLGFRVLCDGGEEMHGTTLGLGPGEFITGLLPNLYSGPVFGSFPVLGVLLNLPGIWEGYKEVGRLHNDQILFTLGNHWLDNYSHPNLRESALYRLQQYPDGSLVHIMNPDLQDQYQLTSSEQNNASVLTLATREGTPLAHLVLAVMDPPSSAAPAPARSARPGIQMPSTPAAEPEPEEPSSPFEDSIPSVAPPMLIDDQVQPVLPGTGSSLGGKTIIPDAPSDRIFTLQERGAMLQKVHFSAFMLGYDVFLGTRGELGTKVENPAATFQVRKRTTALVAHVDGVQVDGQAISPGSQIPLDKDVQIDVGDTRLEFRDMRGHQQIPGWPYVGEIRRPASSSYLIWGEEYKVGRSRECRVVLPDQTSNDNIHWKPKVGDGAYIRARTGDIPKANFYTDSIMVSSEHGSIDLQDDEPRVTCNASHCYVFVRRAGEVLPLHPTSKGDERHDADLEPGDEILIGNCLFQVGFSPSDEAIAPAPAPKVEFNPDSLLDAVPEPSHAVDAPSQPVDPNEPLPPQLLDDDPFDSEETELAVESPSSDPMDVGAAPQPLNFEPAGYDSILGEAFLPDEDDALPEPELTAPEALADDTPADADAPLVAEATFNSEFSEPEDASQDQPEGLPEVQEEFDVGAWDEEDFTVATTSQRMPPSAEDDEPDSAGTEVPKPFPEVEDDDFEETLKSLTEGGPATSEPSDAPFVVPDDFEDRAQAAAESSENVPGEVSFTDDNEAQFELGRPLHVILAGWMVNGEAVLGNHWGADLVLPENRIVDDQTFTSRDYLSLKIRGRRASAQILAPSEVLVDESDPTAEHYDDLESRTLDVIRRDDTGEEDFAVRLTIQADKALPDPRARLVALDYDDPLAAALVTRGLPKGHDRSVQLDKLTVTLHYDGESVLVSNYLDGYRDGDGFHPFFVQTQGKRFKTAPEDGTPFKLADGDRLVVGQCVYVIREE